MENIALVALPFLELFLIQIKEVLGSVCAAYVSIIQASLNIINCHWGRLAYRKIQFI